MSFLFWGFAAMWAALGAYMWSLAVRQRKLAEDIEMFSEVLEERQHHGTE